MDEYVNVLTRLSHIECNPYIQVTFNIQSIVIEISMMRF